MSQVRAVVLSYLFTILGSIPHSITVLPAGACSMLWKCQEGVPAKLMALTMATNLYCGTDVKLRNE